MGKIGKVSKINGILRCSLLILLLWLCFLGLVCISCSSASGQEVKPKETMYVSIWLDANKWTVTLVKNVIFYSENVAIELPLNSTLPAFSNGFIGVKCELIPEARKFVLYFEITHSSVIGNITANDYADDIIQEFLKAFGYTGMSRVYEYQETVGSTIVTRKTFGSLDYTIENVSPFFKYKPADSCFSRLINDRLLSKYVPGDSVTSIHPIYTLKKDANSAFSWNFEVRTTTSTGFSPNIKEYADVIDLKELLNSNIPIVETPCQQASIIFVIQNITRVNADKTYITDIKDIRPEGYTIAKSELLPDSVDIKYEPLTPIDNITIDINVNSSTSDQNPFILILILILIAIAVTTLIIAFFLLRKKRKRSEGQ